MRARAGGGFCLGDVAGTLQRDGEGGVGQGVVGSERSEREGRGDGRFETAGIAQGADEAMMSLDMRRICSNGRTKGEGRLGRRAGGEEIKPALGESFGSGSAGLGHDSL